MILVPRIASMSITAWPITALVWRVLICRIPYQREELAPRRKEGVTHLKSETSWRKRTQMKNTPEKPKPKIPKPGSKPESKDDLKSLPMAEVEKKLGSSPEGLTQAEAEKRLNPIRPERA